MLDPRITKLADVLVNYSCAVSKGDKVFIEAIDVPHAFTCELIRLTKVAGGIPLVKLDSNEIKRSLMLNGSDEGWNIISKAEQDLMRQAQCYIGVRGNFNISEMSDVPREQQNQYENLLFKPVHLDIRVPKTRWVVLRWPTPSMAQQAEMSTSAFEDYFFHVCTLDYRKMDVAMQPLIQKLSQTDQVRIKGPGDTDLSFSVKGIPVKGCSGHRNIPDGEVFTAPIKTSVQGIIHYNTPTIYRGETHQNIRLEFKDGKIINATSSNTAKLNEVLDSDPGARYIGEFAIGFNPFCVKPMKDILFDEKIAGSIHFTPGNCYEDTDNGNRSSVHWDMVLMQTPEKGGGELYFDGQLVRKDGHFIVKELAGLNPENLK
ncbi:MAG: aminopeptidase [Chlamydiales bacterium]|nr:aminopeptidase [Chlamydiales bacterium]